MTNPLHRRHSGDLVLGMPDRKTLMLTTTGGTGGTRAIHLTITQPGQPHATVTLTRAQARKIIQHIANNL